MKDIFVNSLNIVSPLGVTAAENYLNVKAGISGVNKFPKNKSAETEKNVSYLKYDTFQNTHGFSKYENLIVSSVSNALERTDISASDQSTIFIFSTTKGNISLLDELPDSEKISDEVNLENAVKKITSYFGNTNEPVVISNACISGVVALLYARRVLESGAYKNAIVTGADCINNFIYSGFSSFQALSEGNCKPFSSTRDGINLGEAAATIILTSEKNSAIRVLNGAITNDANHISGPSRTGEELFAAIDKAIRLSEIDKSEIGFISAHGTATPFNDEMEAKAIKLAGLSDVPVNSMKGYFGHTLGAAGLVESVIGILSLEEGVVIPTMGFTSPVVEPNINVSSSISKKPNMKCFLKTASGFGGCNAAIIFSKS